LLAPGKRAAFGDGRKIIWGPWSAEIFKHNPKIARPGQERDGDLQWFKYHKGSRWYNSPAQDCWIWNYDFRVSPGEICFGPDDRAAAETGYVVIEPNVPWHKSVAPNKDWGEAKFQVIADMLRREGADVVQFSHGKRRLAGVRVIETPTIRRALAALALAGLAIVPEGGLHHAAAALDVPAIVLFGGFIPPAIMGYDGHENLTGGATEFCGRKFRCEHCAEAMAAISVEQVYSIAWQWLNAGKTTRSKQA